jgi:hypothetical protein
VKIAVKDALQRLTRPAALIALAAIAACSALPGTAPLAPPANAGTGKLAKRVILFVGTYDNGKSYVNEYLLGSTKSLRTVRIAGALGLGAIAVDASGYLYAVTYRGRTDCVTRVYRPGSAGLAYVLGGASYVRSIAVAPLGGVSVGSSSLGSAPATGWIGEYPSGRKQPASRIDNVYANALAFDSAGNLYVEGATAQSSSATNYIAMYAPGAQSPSLTITSGIDNPGPIAVGGNGTIYVANFGATGKKNSISVYPAGATQPAYTIARGLRNPKALAVARNGTLYVANAGTYEGPGYAHGSVAIYAPGATSPSQVLTNNGLWPVALALDPSGNLYVAYEGSSPNRSTVTAYRNATKAWYQISQPGLLQLALGPS